MEQKFKYNPKFSENLRRLRYESGFSQEQLCAKLQCDGCDISRSTYAKYESNLLNIRIDVVVALKKLYKCDYDEFFKDIN